MHTVFRYYRQLALRPKQVSKYIVFFQKHTFMLFMTFTLHFQLHLMKSLKMCSIVSFYKLYNEYLGLKYHIPKQQLTDYSKLQAVCLYHKCFKKYKLLNI